MKHALFAAAAAVFLAPAAALAPIPAAAQEAASISNVASGQYKPDPTHAYIVFTYTHMGMSHPQLRFNKFDATLTLDSKDPTKSRIEVAIDPNSVDSGVPKLDEHLTGPDFFNTAKPGNDTITFVATKLERTDVVNGVMIGDLTMNGITKPVTLDVTLNGAGPSPASGKPTVGVSARGTLKRSEWGIDKYVPAVGDTVDFRIEAEFVKAS